MFSAIAAVIILAVVTLYHTSFACSTHNKIPLVVTMPNHEENQIQIKKKMKVEKVTNFQSPPKCEISLSDAASSSVNAAVTNLDRSTSCGCADKVNVKDLLLNEANYDIDNPSNVRRRENYLSWESYFMAIAYLSAQRSKHPVTQSGACIVDEFNRIVGIGYNGFPRGCSDDCLPWASDKDTESVLHTYHPYNCHAEVNAILNKSSTDVKGSRMYVPELPCNECCKMIIQSGISEIIYFRNQKDDDSSRASRIMFAMAGVNLRQYKCETQIDPLDFSIYGARCDDNIVDESVNKERDKFRELLRTEALYDVDNPLVSKRIDYLSWDDYFTCVAYLSARRSKDPNTQVGAVIVDENKCIISIGYNGFPRGCSDEYLPWARTGDSNLHKKYAFVTHAGKLS